MSVMGVVRNPTSGKPNAGPNHRPCQYIRGQGLVADDLDGAQIVSRGLSGPAVSYDFVADLLAFVEIVHSCAFDRADMHENVLAAVVRLYEAKTFLAVKPLHASCGHVSPFLGVRVSTRTRVNTRMRVNIWPRYKRSRFVEIREECR